MKVVLLLGSFVVRIWLLFVESGSHQGALAGLLLTVALLLEVTQGWDSTCTPLGLAPWLLMICLLSIPEEQKIVLFTVVSPSLKSL